MQALVIRSAHQPVVRKFADALDEFCAERVCRELWRYFTARHITHPYRIVAMGFVRTRLGLCGARAEHQRKHGAKAPNQHGGSLRYYAGL